MVKLTVEMVAQKAKTDNIQKVKKLDMWSSELDDVTLVKDMLTLEICSLSLNKLTSLKFFSYN